MDIDRLTDLRNLLVLGIFLSVTGLQPEASFALVRPFISFWRRLQACRSSIAARFRSSGKERFWEIDMTKFEP